MAAKVTIFALFMAMCEGAFLSHHHSTKSSTFRPAQKSKPLQLFDQASDFIASGAANSAWLATIDSDIASIADDDFGTVFAGGLIVMAGGLISALIVGAILEKGDLYSKVAAESYMQAADDEEFWKGLSEEETKKTKELLQKIKEAKEGGAKSQELEPVKAAEPSPVQAKATTVEPTSPERSSESKPADMFSDY